MGPNIENKQSINSTISKKYISWFCFDIPEKWAYCNREFIKAALARRLMLDSKEIANIFLKVEKTEPEIFCYGKSIAKISFSSPIKEIKSENNPEDISNIKIISPNKKEEDTAFPVVLKLSEIEDNVSYSREVDTLLTKYNLKNQKQRANGYLNWQINPGQDKKAGM